MTEPLPALDRFAIRMEFTYSVPPARIWKAITEELQAWWGPPYLLVDSELTELILEPRLGGRLYEKWGGSDGGIWGEVTSIRHDHWLEIRGQMGLRAPAVAIVCFEIDPVDAGCLLKFSHVATGGADSQAEAAFTKGWKELLGDRLRRWLEQGVRQDEVPAVQG